ncbi:GDSL-type esterase/lipase family protein [Granulicella aggregans]|uniref:GDSL-type esterase/lipase family protein n=1 Tax=Granulicella aggregans TaxID=474949 RepID=UPI0021E0D53A|nr:GDSL-type esterase/lipase family protein [Granulicella aggregans]
MKIQVGQAAFPIKTALAVATIALSLTAWHWRVGKVSAVYPPGLDWHSLSAVGDLPWLHRPAPAKTVTHSPAKGAVGTAAQAQQPPDALLIDNAGSLDKFYASLAKLDAHSAHSSATVVHFGDSPTTADLITGDVRQQLQQRFGDAGPGFNLIAKPWAWYQHRDIDETDKGWKFTTAVGLMREGQFGIGGVGFDGSKDASARYKFSGASPDSMQLIWKSQTGGGSVAVDADDNEVATVSTATPIDQLLQGALATPETPVAKPVAVSAPQFKAIQLPAGTKTVSLKVTDGNVHLYGVIFERHQPGLTYDSIGLNGASITVLSRAIAKDMLKQSFAHLHPDLIVINYGTNEAGFASFIGKQYEGELRLAIARVHEAAPDASILLMSPMDRGERGAGNAISTMDTIPKIVDIQRRVAADTGCAFFNTFQAMGGDGTMQRWYEGKPRLVGGDLIHPTPQGAKIVATAFVDQIQQGYKRYKSRIGLDTAAATPSATQATSPIGENR